MTVAVLMLVFRKPGTTMAEFTEHYEKQHIALLREYGGEHFPLSHVRHYPERRDGPAAGGDGLHNRDTPATLFAGQQQLIDCDCITEIVFEDDAHLQRFSEATMGQQRIKDDEKMFLDTEKTTIVKRAEVAISTSSGTRRHAGDQVAA